MESNSPPTSPTTPASGRNMVWRLSSSTGSVTTGSTGSIGGKSQLVSSGRGGSGNIRRHSFSVDGMSKASSGKSTTEDLKDDVIPPKGLELTVSSTIGIKSSGRGGSGNINGSRRLLQLFGDLKPPNTEELDAKEREVLAAHRAKKLAQNSLNKTTYGRGGLGNLPNASKHRKSVDSPRNRHIRRPSSVNSRRSTSSSIKRRGQQKGKVPETQTIDSADSYSLCGPPSQLFFEPESPPSSPPPPPQPIASTSKLPPPQQPLPKAPKPPSLALESPPSPLINLLPTIPNRPLNRPDRASVLATSLNQFNTLPPEKAGVCIQKQSAGGGAEWRLITQVREERRGTRKYIIEEPAWELFSREDIRREKQEAHEMKMMKKWVEKGKRKGWVANISDGYVSEPA